jgi:hypothetical protein
MADVLETVDKTETILIIGAIGVGLYLLYQAGGAFADFLNNLTGASAENTYTNAATQTVQHPITTAETIAGGFASDIGSIFNPAPTLPSQLSSVGYSKIGASGQHWNCTGPQGQPNDTCVPVTVDASGNQTATGAAVLASQAN